jgi:hypothetical protein
MCYIFFDINNQGCQNGRFIVKITVRTPTSTVWTSTSVRDYPADMALLANGKNLSMRTRTNIRADAGLSMRT